MEDREEEINSEKKIPDNVVPYPNSLPYASDLAAPVIKPDHSLSGWKHGAVHSANKHYTDKFETLKKQFEELAEDFKWNDIMFNAEFRMKPVIGNEYHLYTKSNTNNKHYISLFAPHEKIGGNENYVGTFRLNYDNRWEKIK